MSKKIDKVQELENRINELDNQLKRAIADYHNLEKRVAEGRSELTRWGTNELLAKILPVLDHLDQVVDRGRSILSERSESKDWYRGVELAVKELQSVLTAEGLEQIAADPATSLGTGSQFDPNLHEAVDVREMPPSLDSSGEPEDNIILEVVRKGYTLNGKVLRPAAVVVGRKSESSNMNKEVKEEEKGDMSS